MSANLRYSYRPDTIIKSIFQHAACGRFRKEKQELSHKIGVYCEYIELVLVGEADRMRAARPDGKGGIVTNTLQNNCSYCFSKNLLL